MKRTKGNTQMVIGFRDKIVCTWKPWPGDKATHRDQEDLTPVISVSWSALPLDEPESNLEDQAQVAKYGRKPRTTILSTVSTKSKMHRSFLLEDKKGTLHTVVDVPCKSVCGDWFHVVVHKNYWCRGRTFTLHSLRDDLPTGSYVIYEIVNHEYYENTVGLIIKRDIPKLETPRKVSNWIEKNATLQDAAPQVIAEYWAAKDGTTQPLDLGSTFTFGLSSAGTNYIMYNGDPKDLITPPDLKFSKGSINYTV